MLFVQMCVERLLRACFNPLLADGMDMSMGLLH